MTYVLAECSLQGERLTVVGPRDQRVQRWIRFPFRALLIEAIYVYGLGLFGAQMLYRSGAVAVPSSRKELV